MRYHTTTDPGAWQNELPTGPSGNNYRGKADIRQPSGGIEFVNTKDEEIVTYYYTNGSFFRFNKFSVDLFSPVSMQTHVYGDVLETINKNKISHIDGSQDDTLLGDKLSKTGDVDKNQKHGEDFIKNSEELHSKKRLFEIKRCKHHNPIDQAEKQEKSGNLAPCPTEEIEIQSIYTSVPMEWIPSTKAGCSNEIAQLIDPIIEYKTKSGGGGIAIDGGWGCLTCWGDGLSPSSQDGKWEPEPIKKEIKQTIIDLTEKLAKSEKEFGTSKNPQAGTEVRSSNKNVVENIGNALNTMESYRKDPKGKLVPYGMKVDPFGSGVYPQFRESPLIEKVHVDPVPGGEYHKNVANKYSLSVGSQGITIKTSGDVDLFGIQTNIISERTVIQGTSEVIIGGERVDISGDIITLRPRKIERTIEDGKGKDKTMPSNDKEITEPEQQVLVDGNLNVGMNAIIAGGAHIEGELTLNHVTAPCEYQITETDFEIEKQPVATDPCNGATLNVEGAEEPCVDTVKDTTHADLLMGHLIGHNEEFIWQTELANCPCCDAPHSHQIIIPCGMIKIVSVCAPNSIQVHPHYHWFKNMPLKLIRDTTELEVTVGDKTEVKALDPNSAVRAIGARNNFAIKNSPMPVTNSTTNNTVIEKFEEC